jgi:hypothetical protein
VSAWNYEGVAPCCGRLAEKRDDGRVAIDDLVVTVSGDDLTEWTRRHHVRSSLGLPNVPHESELLLQPPSSSFDTRTGWPSGSEPGRIATTGRVRSLPSGMVSPGLQFGTAVANEADSP